ncbi:MAG: hypothetical protein WBA74_14910, partial [Cyclobacteriaceae bacterium]
MKKLFSIALLALLSITTIQAQYLVRTPSISPDGTMIAYSLQGDIWTMNLANKIVKRVTIHEAYESNPVWNDKGDEIAFTSNRNGNNDIYTIPAEGG